MNEFLTRIIERLSLYSLIQEKIVPFEVRVVSLVTRLFGIEFTPVKDGLVLDKLYLRFSWNCLGWQSLLLFLLSLFVSLRGISFSLSSKIETIILGLLGIFWVNILRISLVVILAYYNKPVFGFMFHNYLAAFVTILYLFLFWWFAYKFVLEEKKT